MRFNLTILLLSLLTLPSLAQARGTVYLKDYLDKDKESGADAMGAIRKALDDCVRLKADELILPPGTLNIKPGLAFEEYQIISNNSASLKRIAFLLRGMKNFAVKGQGTRLLFDGYISPFSIRDCENISVEGISIDYARPFVSEGRVVDSGEGWMELAFPEDYIVRMQDGCLVFADTAGNTYPYIDLLEFDSDLREVAYHVCDHWVPGGSLPAERTARGTYRICRNDLGLTGIGNTVIFGALARPHPAFTLWECDGFSLRNVNIYNCCGMGVIAQCSKDIELNKVNVVPTPGSGRVISISADATHFINCKGFIKMMDCDFRNQVDDATNIHGWYMAVSEITGPSSVILKWHSGGNVRFLKKGMTLEMADSGTAQQYARLKIRDVKYLNSECAEVGFESAVPANAKVNDVVAADDGYPDVLISGCYIGNNRARGLLIGSRGKVIIENCTFHTAGSAILFEGDCQRGDEQSGVRDVTIRNNVFLNCMYGSREWGSAVIAVGSSLPSPQNSRYHKNIIVENNLFKGFDNRIVNLYCVDGFTFRGNTVEMTGDYPAAASPEDRYIFNHCDNVFVEQGK